MAIKKQKARVKRRERKNIEKGQAHIVSSFNNTMVTLSDLNGNVISWASAGQLGFRGSRKSTPFAATVAVENALNKSRAFGLSEIDVYIKGIGPGRDVVLNVLRAARLRLGMIVDRTPIPHNGTRSRKAKHNR